MILRGIREGMKQNMMCDQSFETSVCQADKGVRRKGVWDRGNNIGEAIVAPVIHHCNCNSSASSMKIQHMEIPAKCTLDEQLFIKNTIQPSWSVLGIRGTQFSFTSNFLGVQGDWHSTVLPLLACICEITMSLGRAGSGHRETVCAWGLAFASSQVSCTGMMVWFFFYIQHLASNPFWLNPTSMDDQRQMLERSMNQLPRDRDRKWHHLSMWRSLKAST